MLPDSLFVKPVPESDLVAFQFPFELEGKALDDGSTPQVVEALEDGDLIIQGWAAEFDGVDRQGENFTDGAFQRGIKSFLAGGAPLCFHHKHDQVLGQVLDLEEVEGKGLKMRARVDGAIKDHPTLGTIYQQIKRGTLKNLSVGGFFRRTLTPAGYRIGDMDFTEISVTGVPVHPKPAFSVVAGKALESSDAAQVETPEEYDLSGLNAALDSLSQSLDRIEEGKAVKGDPLDLRFLSTLLQLEQVSNSVVTAQEINEDSGDQRVDALATRVKNYLDSVAREAHALASELGPLPGGGY
jgi:HK97 family phage prohead protease